jgi:hypothetical protein
VAFGFRRLFFFFAKSISFFWVFTVLLVLSLGSLSTQSKCVPFWGFLGFSTQSKCFSFFSQVRLQTQKGNTYAGPLDCIRQIVRKEGFKGFFRGTGPPIVGNMPINALVFASYGEGIRFYSSRGAIEGLNSSTAVRPVHHFIAGSMKYCSLLNTSLSSSLACQVQLLVLSRV